SEDIVIDNILDQIENSLNIDTIDSKQYLFNYFDNRINELLETYTDEKDEYPEVLEKIDNILNTISKRIEEVFGFDIEYSEVIDIEKKLDYVRSMYEFFTIKTYENVLNLTKSFIVSNIESYIKELENVDKSIKKNLSYVHLSKSIDNRYTSVIYHLSDIINTMEFSSDMYAEDVFEIMVCRDMGEEVNSNISSMFIDNEWVEINYEQPITSRLIKAIHGNSKLIKDLKIKLLDKYRDK